MNSRNDDVTDLNITGFGVSMEQPSWADEFWTVYTKENCSGRSALLPVKSPFLMKDYPGFLHENLYFDDVEETIRSVYVPARFGKPELKIWTYDYLMDPLEEIEAKSGCQNLDQGEFVGY